MNRVEHLLKKINEIFTRIEEMPPVYTHIIEVSQACKLIALKRGENVELATIAGLLHDIASLENHDIELYKVHGLTSENHAEMSADTAMKILLDVNLTTHEENDIICTAIRKHSNKFDIDTPFDEVIKDADVFAHGLSKNFRTYRWKDLCQEFDIPNLLD